MGALGKDRQAHPFVVQRARQARYWGRGRLARWDEKPLAGKPRRKAIVTELEFRTREYFEIESGAPCPHTHLDYACEWLANGGTMVELAAEMSITLGFHVFGGQIRTYLGEVWPSECESALSRARARGAHALAENALELVDAPAGDQTEVSRAASRARVRHWTAERWNRGEFAGQQAASVSISIGTLHLDALRAPKSIALPSEPVSSGHLLADAQEVVITPLTPLPEGAGAGRGAGMG